MQDKRSLNKMITTQLLKTQRMRSWVLLFHKPVLHRYFLWKELPMLRLNEGCPDVAGRMPLSPMQCLGQIQAALDATFFCCRLLRFERERRSKNCKLEENQIKNNKQIEKETGLCISYLWSRRKRARVTMKPLNRQRGTC